MLDDLRQLRKEASPATKAALIVFFVLGLAYVLTLSVMQHRSLAEFHENQPEMVYLQTIDGKIQAVPKDDYDAANEKWKEDHPEDYGIDTNL